MPECEKAVACPIIASMDRPSVSNLLKFNDSHEFYEAISECDKLLTDVHPDYVVRVSALHDVMEVYTIDGEHVCDITELDELQNMWR